MNAKEVLIKLQKMHYKVPLRSEEQKNMMEMLKKEVLGDDYEKIMLKYEERQKSLLTPYEDFHLVGLMDQGYEELRDLIHRKKINVNGKAMDYTKQFPLYGTIKSHDFQACVIPCDDVPLIVFNEGLLHFTNRILSILNFENMYYRRLTSEQRIKLTKEFIDVMIWFHFDGEPYYAENSGLDSPIIDLEVEEELRQCKYEVHEILMRLITVGVFFFFVAHEYAHTILEPLNETKFLNKVINNIEVKTLANSWKEELRADAAAFVLSKETGNIEYGISSLWATVIMYFSHIHDLEEEGTHPPFIMRIENIDEMCKRNKCVIDYENFNKIVNSKIKAYTEFLEYIDNKGMKIRDRNDIVEVQNILYNEFELQDLE